MSALCRHTMQVAGGAGTATQTDDCGAGAGQLPPVMCWHIVPQHGTICTVIWNGTSNVTPSLPPGIYRVRWEERRLRDVLAQAPGGGAYRRAPGGKDHAAPPPGLVYHHLSVLSGLLDPPARLYYWRTQRGAEVDFVAERGQALVAFEAKSARRVTYNDAKGLRAFLADHPECRAAILVYRGPEVVPLGSRVVALPWEFLARGAPTCVDPSVI